MKLYQLFYLPHERYVFVLAGFSGLIGGTLVDWAPVSVSLLWESALTGVLTLVVFVCVVAAFNLVARLQTGDWLADA